MTPTTLTLLPWDQLSEAQAAQVRGLTISQQQIDYAGSLQTQLEGMLADTGPDRVGLAILDGAVAVGFLVLKRGSKAPDWAPAQAAVISGMRIDQSRQGQRLGSTALRALSAWVHEHWPGCTALALSVDEENARGIKAYAAAGFVDHGVRVQGRIGWVRYMSRPVASSAAAAL